MVQFRFSKNATKFKEISQLILSLLRKFQINWEISTKFCGLLKKTELGQFFLIKQSRAKCVFCHVCLFTYLWSQ